MSQNFKYSVVMSININRLIEWRVVLWSKTRLKILLIVNVLNLSEGTLSTRININT